MSSRARTGRRKGRGLTKRRRLYCQKKPVSSRLGHCSSSLDASKDERVGGRATRRLQIPAIIAISTGWGQSATCRGAFIGGRHRTAADQPYLTLQPSELRGCPVWTHALCRAQGPVTQASVTRCPRHSGEPWRTGRRKDHGGGRAARWEEGGQAVWWKRASGPAERTPQ